MKKGLIIVVIIIAVFFLFSSSKNKNTSQSEKTNQQEQTKTETQNKQKSTIEDVCTYFPKELVEKAIGKPIVKVKSDNIADPACNYYITYSETYEHTPYGNNRAGGPHIVVVYDTKDFVKDRVTNEKFGTKYEVDSSIKMNNFVMKNNVNKIWQVALDYGDEKYIRIKSVDDAVTGEELVKIAAEFASK